MIITILKAALTIYGGSKMIELIKEKIGEMKLRAAIRAANNIKEVEKIPTISKIDIQEAAKAQQDKYVVGIEGRKILPVEDSQPSYHDYEMEDGSPYISNRSGVGVDANGEMVSTYNGIPLYEEGNFNDDEY